MNKHTLALLKVHSTAVLFGASGIFGALIQSSADTLVLGRVWIAFFMISLYFIWKKQPLVSLSKKEIGQLALSGALLAAHWVTFFVAVKVGGVALATLGFASFPAFVALFEVIFFKEKLHLKEIILLVAITIGLILVTPEFTLGSEGTQGLLWGVFSALSYGILAIVNRKSMSKLSGTQASWTIRHTSKLVAISFCRIDFVAVFCGKIIGGFSFRLVLDLLYWLFMYNGSLYIICFQP